MRSVPVSNIECKCPFVRRKPASPDHVAAYSERHSAEGRLATIGMAYCRRCNSALLWLDAVWFDDHVSCTCGGSVGIGFRGILRGRDTGWIDGKKVVHAVSVDLEQASITLCKRPATSEELSSGRLVDAPPNCLECAVLPLAA